MPRCSPMPVVMLYFLFCTFFQGTDATVLLWDYMGRGHTDTKTHRHCDNYTELTQWADSVKINGTGRGRQTYIRTCKHRKIEPTRLKKKHLYNLNYTQIVLYKTKYVWLFVLETFFLKDFFNNYSQEECAVKSCY